MVSCDVGTNRRGSKAIRIKPAGMVAPKPNMANTKLGVFLGTRRVATSRAERPITPSNTKIAAASKLVAQGRIITATPNSPITIADQRRIPTFSRSKTAAPRVTRRGLTWMMAEIVMIGTRARESTNRAVPNNSDKVRPMTQGLRTIFCVTD